VCNELGAPTVDHFVTVGVGLVGCGRWGLNYLRAFSELEGCRVVAACDLSQERLAEAQRRSPGLLTVTNVVELLANPEVDVVVVATDATQHYELTRAALDAGKDCLVEKPLTTDVNDARHLRDLAAERNRLLMVGHVFRFNPGINYLQKVIGSGVLGQLEYLTFTRTNLGPIRSDVNVAWDLMTHDVSILLHFLNQTPLWLSAQGASFLSPRFEDVAFATLGFDGGVVANIRASWLDPRKVREITVVGSSKMAFFNDLDPQEPVRIFDKGALREPSYESFGEFKLVTRTGDVVSPAIAASEPLKNQCQHFLRSVLTRGPVLSDGSDGLRVVEVLAAINRSMAQRGAPVSFRDTPAEAA
jgi:predicted dehydrogenase